MSKPSIGVEFALTDVRWCEPNAAKPAPLAEIGYYIGDKTPQAGETVWLRVEKYDGLMNSDFWAVYESWETQLNGIDEAPEKMDELRLIRCEVISPFENETFWKKKPLEHPGIIEVRCSEVLNLSEIPARFVSNQEPLKLDFNSEWNKITSIFRRPDVTFDCGEDQSACWQYVVTNALPRCLVLHQFLVIDDKWEICNRPIEIIGDETRIIKAMAARQ